MTNGADQLPEDFFRARPHRSELHRFLTEARVQETPLAEPLEDSQQPSEPMVESVKKEPQLHIPHQQPEPTPQQKTAPSILLHIPHRITASRLSRHVHLTESGKEAASAISSLLAEPVRQIGVHQASAIPLSIPPIARKKISQKIARPIVIHFPAGGVHRKASAVLRVPLFKRSSVSGRQVHLPIPVTAVQKRIRRVRRRQSEFYRVLQIPRAANKIPTARQFVSLPIIEADRINPGVRQMPRHFLPSGVPTGKGQLYRALALPVVAPRRQAAISKKAAFASTLPKVEKRHVTNVPQLAMIASEIPAQTKYTSKRARMPMQKVILVPAMARQIANKKAMAAATIKIVSRIRETRRIAVIPGAATRHVQLPITKYLPDPSLRLAAKRAAEAKKEASRVAVQFIIDSTRGQIKNLPKFRKPVTQPQNSIFKTVAQLPGTIFKPASAVQVPAPKPTPEIHTPIAKPISEVQGSIFNKPAPELQIVAPKPVPENHTPIAKPIPDVQSSIFKPALEAPSVLFKPAAEVRIETPKLASQPQSSIFKPTPEVRSETVPVTPHQHESPLKKRFVLPKPKFTLPKRDKPSATGTKLKRSGIVGEITRFAVTSIAIFAISFSVMNAPALSQLLMAKINIEETAVKETALEKVTNTNADKHLAPILPTAGMKRESQKVYPPLRINPAPLENRIVIPKIGRNIPVVDVSGDSLLRSDWSQLEKDIQGALKDGVVHYPGTADPGQMGNVFVTGHSSYYLWDKGGFKDVFARLHDLDVGDEFTIFWNQNTYRYRIRERKVVSPEETSVLKQPTDEKIATLMTCTPIGTAKNRLILVAEQL